MGSEMCIRDRVKIGDTPPLYSGLHQISASEDKILFFTFSISIGKELFFLKFSLSKGNDLITPREEFNFPGLMDGDRWCLCVDRWIEAYQNECAPRLVLEATNVDVLKKIDIEILKKFALDIN